MGPLGAEELGRRLAALAEEVPLAPAPHRREGVRRRVRAVRRRQATAGVLSAGAVLVTALVLAPSPGPTPASTLESAAAPARPVTTFDFPDQGAVAEVVLPSTPVRAGAPSRYVVRVRTERGRVGGVDLTFGDGRITYLDGAPRCTPDAGPTEVELWADHVYAEPGSYLVRARPQLLTGCRQGRGLRAPGGTPGQAVVRVG